MAEWLHIILLITAKKLTLFCEKKEMCVGLMIVDRDNGPIYSWMYNSIWPLNSVSVSNSLQQTWGEITRSLTTAFMEGYSERL